jgi:hypothetical protein
MVRPYHHRWGWDSYSEVPQLLLLPRCERYAMARPSS